MQTLINSWFPFLKDTTHRVVKVTKAHYYFDDTEVCLPKSCISDKDWEFVEQKGEY